MKLQPEDWDNQLERMNMMVNNDNGRAVGMVKVSIRGVWRFPSNKFWNIVGCLISAPNFGIGVSILWEKKEEQNISEKN